jgi:hypothetical protein
MARITAANDIEVICFARSAFGASARFRLVRVLATQAVVPYFTDVIMTWQSAQAKCDMFAIAPYFGPVISTASQVPLTARLHWRTLCAGFINDPPPGTSKHECASNATCTICAHGQDSAGSRGGLHSQ